MKIFRLEKSIKLPITIEECWEFFSSPKNLKIITPDYMGFSIIDGEKTKMYSGQIIKYNVTPIFGINMKWVTEISHVKEYKFFVDEQRFGRRNDMKDKLERIIDTIRSLREEMAAGGIPANNASSGNIAGLPPDSPPVKQKKRYIYSGRGSRRMWLTNKKNG